MSGPRRETDVRIVGGCPCGFWSTWNCRYTRAVQVCKYRGPEPEALRELAANEAERGER